MWSFRMMGLVVALWATVGSYGPAAAMDAYLGRKRPLVVFAPNDQHPGLTRQRNILSSNRTQLLERDVVVVYATDASVSHDFGAPQPLSASSLRQRYKVSAGQFRVMLFGKDGRVKLDSSAPVSAIDLVAEIDRMPMRREEARRRPN
jgi:hypothetical protein